MIAVRGSPLSQLLKGCSVRGSIGTAVFQAPATLRSKAEGEEERKNIRQ